MTTLAPPTPNRSTSPRLPAPPLRNRVLGAVAVAWLAVTGLALGLQLWLDTRPAQPVVCAVLFLAMIATALMTMRDHHPHRRFGPANHVTLVRAMLTALTASLLIEPAGAAIAWTVAAATTATALLDGVDGWLARRTRMNSTFGARFDMETDAFFMFVLSALVWRHDKAGIWVMAIGLMRYAFVAGGGVLPWLARPLRSTPRGKAVAVAQVVGLGLAILPVVPVPVSTLVCALALAALVWSFAIDTWFLWVRRASG